MLSTTLTLTSMTLTATTLALSHRGAESSEDHGEDREGESRFAKFHLFLLEASLSLASVVVFVFGVRNL